MVNDNLKELKIFVNENGKSPFNEWFVKLKDKQIRKKVVVRLKRVKYSNYGYYRRLGSDFLELKEKVGGGTRIYLGEDGDRLIILLLGGNKSSQSKDISKARAYWQEYKNRK